MPPSPALRVVASALRRNVLPLLCFALVASEWPRAQDQRQDPPQPAIRVGLRARQGGADRLNPLRYVGGFETKTLLYETLVLRGPDGRLRPGLASHWQVAADGKSVQFLLRENARFHDGTKVTAADVQMHFRRWLGLPEHDWILANRRIDRVTVESEQAFTVHLTEPSSVLSDLCCINPCAIVGPGARDWEGEFVRPMGTGPFRFESAAPDQSTWRLVRTGDEQALEIRFHPRGRDEAPLDAIEKGELDVFVGGWDEDLPTARLEAMARDERFAVDRAPGSSVVYLSFRLTEGPTKDAHVRHRIAAAIDREQLLQTVEGGHGVPTTTWAAPSVAFWPKGPARKFAAAEAASSVERVALSIAAGRGENRAARVAEAVAEQLRAKGFDVELRRAPVEPKAANSESGEVRAAARQRMVELAESCDLRVEITHGMPYDPHQSLVARFGPVRREGEPAVRAGNTEDLLQLVTEASAVTDEAQCVPIYTRIQDLMDREALIVPLYVPHRTAVRVREIEGIGLPPDVYRVDLTALHWVAASPR